MAKSNRPIRHDGDPEKEKIVENHIDQTHAVGARFTSLFEGSRAEVLSAIPVAPPVGYKKQPSMVDHIRGLVRSEHLRWAAEGAGAESFEEADDFDVGDDLDPTSPYEDEFEPPAPPPPGPAPAPAPAPAAEPVAPPAPSAATPPAASEK